MAGELSPAVACGPHVYIRLPAKQTDPQTDGQKTENRQTDDRQAGRQTDRPTQGRVCIAATFPSGKSLKLSEPQTVKERKRDRETERQTDGRRGRQADRRTRERERESEDVNREGEKW